MPTILVSGEKILKQFKINKHKLMELIQSEAIKPYSPAYLEQYNTMVGFRLMRKYNDPLFNPLKSLLLPNFGVLYPYLNEILFDINELEALYPETARLRHNHGRLSNVHKEAAREAAKTYWQHKPSATIEEVILSDEVNCVLDGKTYHPQTLRGWIKDLCPDNRRGRRPNHS